MDSSAESAEKQSLGWSTSSEKGFINFLAERRDAQGLLTGYLAGIKKRTEWGTMDPQQVQLHAEWKLHQVTREKWGA